MVIRRQQAAFERAERLRRVRDELESKVLPQDVVVQRLVPLAKTEWAALSTKTTQGTMTLPELDDSFGGLGEGLIPVELNLLLTTTFAAFPGHGEARGVQETARSNLLDYKLLRKLGAWLPKLLLVHQHLRALCGVPLEEDALRGEMAAALARIEASTAGLTLASISRLLSTSMRRGSLPDAQSVPCTGS